MLTQVHHLILVVLTPREVRKTVHVTSDCQAVIRWGALSTLVPFVEKEQVLAPGLGVTSLRFVEDIRRQCILYGLLAECVEVV